MFGTGQKAMLDLGRTTYKPDQILWVALNSIAEPPSMCTACLIVPLLGDATLLEAS